MKPIILVLILVSFLSGCSRQEPALNANIEDQLVNLYAELIVLNEQSKLDTMNVDLISYNHNVERLLTSYGFTKEQFYSQIEQQLQTPESFRQFYDTLRTRLEQRRTMK